MRLIALSGASGRGCCAAVDDEDYDRLARHRWYALRVRGSHTVYARRTEVVNGQRVTIYMHREVKDPGDGFDTEHIDGNGLNNTRDNLTRMTRAQNMRASYVRHGFDRWEHLL